MNEVENPSISHFNATGYDIGCEPDDKEQTCPICGKTFETLYINHHLNEVVGCDECVRQKWWYEYDET